MNKFTISILRKIIIFQAHQTLMTGLIDEVGQYRNSGVGVMSNDRVIHMAHPENQVQCLMGDLLNWLAEGNEHPLVQFFIMISSLYTELLMAMNVWGVYGKL